MVRGGMAEGAREYRLIHTSGHNLPEIKSALMLA